MLGRVADPITERAVAGCNALTARWARRHLLDKSTLMSGAGVWPLLAILAASANGGARLELERAIGVPADEAGEMARSMLALLESCPAVSAALGVWIDRRISVRDTWEAALPAGALGRLSGDGQDQRRLDSWADEKTLGIIPQMPVAIDDDTLLLLATAMTVRTRWLKTFETDSWPRFKGDGAWTGRHDFTTISRMGVDLDDVSVVTSSSLGPMTLLEVQGESEISVVLALADQGAVPGDVMAEVATAVASNVPGLGGSSLKDGDTAPGLSAAGVASVVATPSTLDVMTVPFRIKAQHDLLKDARLFGLEAACDPSAGHFDAISETPLYVQEGQQAGTAAFSAKGFESASVTAFGISLGETIQPPGSYHHLEITVRYDRPFAFLSLHRPTGLILAAGWVAEPQPVINPEILRW